MAKFADHMEKVAGGIVGGYQKIEDGVVVGLVGMVPVALAYLIYDRVLKKQREKILVREIPLIKKLEKI